MSWSFEIFLNLMLFGNLSVNSHLPFLLTIMTFRLVRYVQVPNIMSAVVSFRNGTHGSWYF